MVNKIMNFEKKTGKSVEDFLIEEYLVKGTPTKDICSKLGICRGYFGYLRKKFSVDTRVKIVPKKYKDWDSLKKRLGKIINKKYVDADGNVIKELGEFPTASQLLGIKESGFINAINYHGGFPFVRERMGYDLKNKPFGFWRKLENVINPIENIINSELTDERGNIIKPRGEFPTDDQLPGSLSYAIQTYHGGLTELKEKMGYRARKRPGYWLIKSNFERELEEVVNTEYTNQKTGEIIKKAGEFPTQIQIRKIKRNDLQHAIEYYNGLESVRREYKKAVKKRQKPIKTLKELQDFISEEESAREIIRFVGSNSHLSEAIEILARKYPHRIMDASRFSRLLVDSHVSLAQFIGPYSMPFGQQRKDALGRLYAEFGNVRGFDELTFDIVRDESMREFNRDPRYMLAKLEMEAGKEENAYVKGLLEKVHAFYREIFELEIPGIPGLSQNPRYIK